MQARKNAHAIMQELPTVQDALAPGQKRLSLKKAAALLRNRDRTCLAASLPRLRQLQLQLWLHP